jgi:branched-chain amino acid transport system permease protein
MAVTVLVDRSKFGFGLRCIRQNESAALMVGINVLHYKIAAFIISGVISAAAGGIYASMVAFVEPKDAFNLLKSIEIPVMVMLGGMGTVLGPLVGSIVYVVLREVVWANFMNWHSAILGLLVVIVIYTMPMGLLGLRLRALNWPRPRSYGVTPRAADLGAAK